MTSVASSCGADDPLQFMPGWKTSSVDGAVESFLIRGTGDRNNPLRRELQHAFVGDELFVQFRLLYAAESIDRPEQGDGEFFVLWLDASEGGDHATHSGHIPNIGIHATGDENRFMIRFSAGAQKFSDVELVGDREYAIAARLWKSQPGPDRPFDQLDLWVDPQPEDEFSPGVSVSDVSAIHQVRWIGFSTGRKTEPSDRIQVSDLRLATSWRQLLDLPVPTPKEPGRTPEPVMVKTIDFERHVLPILRQQCFECHAGGEPTSGVRLDVLDDVLNQVTPFDAAASHLVNLIRSEDAEKRMPPPDEKHQRLGDLQMATLSDWINEGLAWDETLLPTPIPQSNHWAFQPIIRPQVPSLEDDSWVRTPIDAFIASKQAEIGIKPAPPASNSTLMRRLALDLTGLPPTDRPDNAEHDLDATADALIEKLLASPAYGERWARHWLDLARWAESNGHQHNRDRIHAWRYRDYVIRGFVDDKPFSDFIREQIAGDELPYSDYHLIATGFLAAARYSGNELDTEIQRNDILVDVVNTTAKAFLGITMECAQCHTHKFDPISIRDYYRFQAFFAKGQPGNLVLQHESSKPHQLIDARWNVFDQAHERLVNVRRKQGYPEPILVIPKTVLKGLTKSERESLDSLDDQIATFAQTWGWYSPASSSTPLAVAPHEMRWPLPRDPQSIAAVKTYLRIRGEVKSRGPEVEAGWPAVFGSTPSKLKQPRLALADWLASNDNPLTARVWVNRVWQWHFGRGLVETSGNFGTQGTPPTNPRLLDWLASELVDSGWSTKHIHRLILRSNTYRQSSMFSEANQRIDPGGDTFWRWNPRRLEAEAIRDSVLAVAGKLDPTVGGPSVPTQQASNSARRSIYLQQKRENLSEALTVFDAPDSVSSCSARRVSTVALQPLYLLNSKFMNQSAHAFSNRIRQSGSSESDYVRIAFEIALGRPPEIDELARANAYLQENSLQSFCLAMMNLNEFLYIN